MSVIHRAAVASAASVAAVAAAAFAMAPAAGAQAQIAARFLDKSGTPPGAGALFGLAVAPFGTGLYYVDDAVNTLRLLH